MSTGKDEIAQWCRAYLAELLEVAPDTIALDADFDKLGVDSALAASLLIDLEERFGVDLPPEVLFESPNLNTVIDFVHAHTVTEETARS